eukprot:GHRR01013254.1.p1 GENE.GHRR01013254.1~~GHRR01013254.1.p1  ORF type:complete len:143 (+),score=41.06 GHRR01013254.1:226-654(+)
MNAMTLSPFNRVIKASSIRCAASPIARPAPPPALGKKELVSRLLNAKEASSKSFSQIAEEVGLTNVYTAQLFHNQQQLQPNTAEALRKAVPALTDEDVDAMMRAPLRTYDPNALQVNSTSCKCCNSAAQQTCLMHTGKISTL